MRIPRENVLGEVHSTCCAADQRMEARALRRQVSETKKFVTESCQKAVHNAMQVVGGIGYTNVLPLERICRDIRLASIWTGTNEVVALSRLPRSLAQR